MMDGSWLERAIFLLSFKLEEAELRPCEQELKLIKRLKLDHVILELDSTSLVTKLNINEMDRSACSWALGSDTEECHPRDRRPCG
jgi:hypothetical protein